MADANVPITAGSGTNIDTYQIANGDHQQIVREARITAATGGQWTVTPEGKAEVIVADLSRISLLIVSMANSRIYIHIGAWIPSATDFDQYLEPGERWEVPPCHTTQAFSMTGVGAGGLVLWNSGTSA